MKDEVRAAIKNMKKEKAIGPGKIAVWDNLRHSVFKLNGNKHFRWKIWHRTHPKRGVKVSLDSTAKESRSNCMRTAHHNQYYENTTKRSHEVMTREWQKIRPEIAEEVQK